MAKIPLVTRDTELIQTTVRKILGLKNNVRLGSHHFLDAMMLVPISTCLHFDKIFGKWTFSNQEPDEWPKGAIMKDITQDSQFTFCAFTPEQAIGMGLHYNFHRKMDHVPDDFKRTKR